MPFGVKVIFSIGSALIVGLLMLVDQKKDNAGPLWMWRLGKRDPVRNLICRADGSLRKHVKLSLIVTWILWLLCIWGLIPTA
jgi:hypothetical protein